MKRVLACLLTLALVWSMVLPVTAARPTHGTDDEWVTVEELTTQVPESYVVDPATQADAKDGLYNAYFLKDKLQTVCIEIDENNLNYLLQNAIDEPYVLAKSVTIGDRTLSWCGLRTKGNFTLAHAYTDNPGSDRFSFTVNFGEYVTKAAFGEKQTFFGCDRISFNNFFFDKSMLKEFFSLMLMEEMGVPTPQFGLAKLYINGQYYGVYAMVEAMDESILEQHFQVEGKQLSPYLCKPTGTRMRYQDLVNDPSPLYEYDEETRKKLEQMLPIVLDWAKKLELLASGQDFSGNPVDIQSAEYIALLEQIMDVDETLRYFAVHSWLCQLDNMFVCLQNFGLYISPEGVSTLVPWDYDLAFGCYFPSTAENTANYPLDVMYRLNPELWGIEEQQSDLFYKTFPLFYVIYQNDALMERYRGYMLDCSRIAALGGYVEWSERSYDPAYFNSFLEALEDLLLEAAAEPLADNVYYMNWISQPRDVRTAIPNLSRIIAMRSVGVYNQTVGSEAWVAGSGCNLEALGNAIWAESAKSGLLTLVDPYTGIFLTAQYSAGRRSQTPVLGVAELSQQDGAYQTAVTALKPSHSDHVLVWQLRTAVKPESDFIVTVPLAAQYVAQGATQSFYLLSGSELIELDAQRSGNLFILRMNSLGTLAVKVHIPFLTAAREYIPLMCAGVFCVAALAAIGIVTLVRRRRRNKELRQ